MIFSELTKFEVSKKRYKKALIYKDLEGFQKDTLFFIIYKCVLCSFFWGFIIKQQNKIKRYIYLYMGVCSWLLSSVPLSWEIIHLFTRDLLLSVVVS